MAIIKRNHVQVEDRRSEPPPALPGTVTHEKSARLLRLEGRVVGIEFTCSCGERSLIEVECDEPAAPAAAAEPEKETTQ